MLAVSRSKMTLLDLLGYSAALLGIRNDNNGSEGRSGSSGGGGCNEGEGADDGDDSPISSPTTLTVGGDDVNSSTLSECGMTSSLRSSTSDGGRPRACRSSLLHDLRRPQSPLISHLRPACSRRHNLFGGMTDRPATSYNPRHPPRSPPKNISPSIFYSS